MAIKVVLLFMPLIAARGNLPWSLVGGSRVHSEDGLTLPLRGCVLAERGIVVGVVHGLPGSLVIPLARHHWVPGGWRTCPQVSWGPVSPWGQIRPWGPMRLWGFDQAQGSNEALMSPEAKKA